MKLSAAEYISFTRSVESTASTSTSPARRILASKPSWACTPQQIITAANTIQTLLITTSPFSSSKIINYLQIKRHRRAYRRGRPARPNKAPLREPPQTPHARRSQTNERQPRRYRRPSDTRISTIPSEPKIPRCRDGRPQRATAPRTGRYARAAARIPRPAPPDC